MIHFIKSTDIIIKTIIISVFCIFNFSVYAQQSKTLKGKVVDMQNNPLIGASVYWNSNIDAVITGNNGEFEINTYSGTTYLVASYVGYESDSIIPTKDYIVFKLKSGVYLKDVVVEHRVSSTFSSTLEPMKTQVMTEHELQKAACCNLSESFETNPSVDVSYSDAVTGTKQIQMLGLAGPYIQITRENMPDIRGLSAFYGLTFVPGTWVESIQVNKGAGSVVNGFESIAGQINVQLRNPLDMDTLFVNAFANQSGRYELNINAKKDIFKNVSSNLLLHGKTLQTKHDENNDGFIDMPIGNQAIFASKTEFTSIKNMHIQFGVKGTYFENVGGQLDFNKAQTISTSNPWGALITINQYDAWSKVGWLSEKNPFKSFALQSSYTYHNQKSIFGLKKFAGIQKSVYLNGMFQNIIGNSDHFIKSGISLQYDNFNESYNTELYDFNEFVPGVYLEYTYTRDTKFSAVLGGRADYHTNYGLFFTPRLHVRYAPKDKLIIRASGGRGQRTAHIFAENSNLFASSRVVEIQKSGDYAYGLQPEVAWNFGGNITYNFKLFYRKGSISTDIYRTQFTNQIVVDIMQNPQKIVFYNLQGESFSNSFQFQIDYELLKRFDVRCAYRWYDVQTSYNGALQKKPFISEHRAFINLAYKTRSNWAFDYTLQWNGSKNLPDLSSNPVEFIIPSSSPDFFVMNAQITKSHNETFDFYLGVENLLGLTQENPIVGASVPFSNYFDSSLIWGPLYGREIYIGIRYRLN